MDTLATQLMYSLQSGVVRVVIAIYKFLERISVPKGDDALIMGVDHKLEFW
jgi:hypothetical protein